MHLLPSTALLLGSLTPRAIFISLDRVLEYRLSEQGGERVDRPRHDGTSPLLVTNRWEAQEGAIVVSEGGFGKRQPGIPAQWDNKQGHGRKRQLIRMQMVLGMVYSSDEQHLLGLCPWAVSGVVKANHTDLFVAV